MNRAKQTHRASRARRLTFPAKISASHQASDNSLLTPLIPEDDTSTDRDHSPNEGDDIVFLPLEGEGESGEDSGEIEREIEEERDVLGPLPSLSSLRQKRPKGILKRPSALKSGSSNGNGLSSPTSPPPSRNQSRWGNRSRVQFERLTEQSSESIELQDLNAPNGQADEKQTDTRQLSGSRIRSSLTKLARLSGIRRKNPQPHHEKLQTLRSHLKLDDLSRNEIELKADLYFHIGNPIKRWRVDRVVPVKLLLQLLKTFCLIVQVILFRDAIPIQRSEFIFHSRVIFESLFIDQFQNGTTVPGDTYFIYSIQNTFKQFDYISRQYFALPDITLGGYDFESIDENGDPTPLTMELTQYEQFDFDIADNSFILNGDTNHSTFYVRKGDNATEVYLQYSEDPLFHRFKSLAIKIPIKNFRIVDPERAECFLFNVTITFENKDNIGIMHLFLRETNVRLSCSESIETNIEDIHLTLGFRSALDVIIIILSFISISLITTTIRRGVKLGKAMRKFYLLELGIKLKWREIRALFPLWHVTNTISDLFIISGTIYKTLVDYSVNGLNDATPTAFLLGTAVFLQAVLIFRYISYFKQLNALTRTIVVAFPELLKFLSCCGVLFAAFVINGWVIIGPYFHVFDSLHGSVEALYSLLTKCNIYYTFSALDREDNFYVWLYSKFYLYTFMVLFLYTVLGLFTSLVIKYHDASLTFDAAYENEVKRFVFSGPLTPNGAALRDVTETKHYADPVVILKRMKRPPPSEEDIPV